MHQSGVMHRDLKSENVLIGANGHARLTDFGISEGNLPIDDEGLHKEFPIGTPEYMAPEMYRTDKNGEASYGWSTDFWALGLVIYEMLGNGAHPFKFGPGKTV
jgi:serine/threonine protein kinase